LPNAITKLSEVLTKAKTKFSQTPEYAQLLQAFTKLTQQVKTTDSTMEEPKKQKIEDEKPQ